MIKKYSYVSLLTDDSYAYGIALLVESLKKVKSQYPLHVLITKDVSLPTIEMLRQLKVTYEVIDIIPISEELNNHNFAVDKRRAGIWKNCWTKFKIFDLIQFEKIVFLDADIMILKNIDHLFQCPHMTAALDGEIFNIWPNDPHFNAGCIVIEPKHEIFEDILKFAKTLHLSNFHDIIIADQEILNLYYKDWPTQTELHLNKWYNIFGPYIPTNLDEDINNYAYFIHFIGRKPWVTWNKHPEENYSEMSYQKASDMIKKACSNINFKLMLEKIKLAVYAICKNEIDNVEAWVKNFSKADYICVLDTGSEDGTWEKLQKLQKKYKNLIIDQTIIKPWRFDKARNESLKLVPEDTTMWFMVDLDERIKDDNWTQKIKEKWTPTFERGSYTYNRDVREGDTVVRAIPEYRIHSRKWNHYKNIVHEAIYNDMEQKEFYVEICTPIDITVWHYPKQNKVTHYAELCEEDLKEYPDDYIMRLQLAIEYEILKEYDKAWYHYEWLIKNKNTLHKYEVARCWFGLGRLSNTKGKTEDALFYYKNGIIECPKLVDNYIDAALIHYTNQQYQQAIELCEMAFKYCYEAAWCGVYDVTTFYPYYILGMSYYCSGEKVKGLGFLEIAYNKNPGDQEIKARRDMVLNEIITELNNVNNIGLY